MAFEADLRAAPRQVWIILIACILPEAHCSAADFGLLPWPDLRQSAYDRFAFWVGPPDGWLYPGQAVLMYLTYGFLHGGLLHLVMNMMALVSLAGPVVASVGAGRFAFAYGALLVAGGIGYALWPSPGIPMVGASGALFGLLGMLMSWDFQHRRRYRRPLRPLMRGAATLILLNLALWVALGGGLAWQAHLGGFVGGWLLACRVRPATPAMRRGG